MTLKIALLAGLAAFAARPACAQQWYVGVYAHDISFVGDTVGLGSANREGGVDTHLGYRTKRLDALAPLGRPQAQAFLSINSHGTSNFASVGLGWPISLGESGFYLRPGFGLAYTDGAAGLPPANAPNLTPQERARRTRLYYTRIDFGSKLLFSPELALGYRFSDRLAGELSYTHISNGQIFHHGKNQGLDDAGVRLVYGF